MLFSLLFCIFFFDYFFLPHTHNTLRSNTNYNKNRKKNFFLLLSICTYDTPSLLSLFECLCATATCLCAFVLSLCCVCVFFFFLFFCRYVLWIGSCWCRRHSMLSPSLRSRSFSSFLFNRDCVSEWLCVDGVCMWRWYCLRVRRLEMRVSCFQLHPLLLPDVVYCCCIVCCCRTQRLYVCMWALSLSRVCVAWHIA